MSVSASSATLPAGHSTIRRGQLNEEDKCLHLLADNIGTADILLPGRFRADNSRRECHRGKDCGFHGKGAYRRAVDVSGGEVLPGKGAVHRHTADGIHGPYRYRVYTRGNGSLYR